MNKTTEPQWRETFVKHKKEYSSDPNEHNFIQRTDLTNQYPREEIQLPESVNPSIALDTLYYTIDDILEAEYGQSIKEKRNRYLFRNYQWIKKIIQAFEIIRNKAVDVNFVLSTRVIGADNSVYNRHILDLKRKEQDLLTDEEFALVCDALTDCNIWEETP